MKKRIILFSFLLTCVASYAQTEIPLTKERQAAEEFFKNRFIKPASYIFEGTVINSIGYWNKTGKTTFTANTIKIEKVIKGDLKPGTIVNVITIGGEVADLHNPDIIFMHSSGDIRFYNNTKHFFLCKPSNPENYKEDVKTDYPFQLSFLSIAITKPDIGKIRMLHDRDNYLTFESPASLYKFLSEEGITVPQDNNNPKKKSIDVKPEKNKIDTSGNSIRYKQNVKNYEIYFAHLLNKSKVSGTNANRNSATTNDLTLSFANPQTTGTSPRYFEFDIVAQANHNNTYFDNCLMRIQYNTSAFGSNVVANNKVTITKGTAFNSTTYIDPNANAIDQTSNTMGIPFGTTSNSTITLNRTLLTTTNQQLIHIKIEIQNRGQNVGLDFVDQSFTPMFSFYSATAQGFNTLSYDNTYYQNPLNNILCQISITNFNSPVNAGTGDILTIDGSDFGATRGTGQVKFKNADDGGATYIQKLNTIDYISWSDNQIQIKVPSIIDSLSTNPDYATAVPGSGTFIVKNSFGDSAISSSPLKIYYGFVNVSNTNLGYQKYKLNLYNNNGYGGYTYRMDTSISNNPLAKAIVLKAFNDWKCYTHFNYKIGTDTTYGTSAIDDINSIYLYYDTTANIQASTTYYPRFCNSTGTVALGEMDLKINRNINWQYDTTGVALEPGKTDFYAVVLHEIGHMHSLTHVNDVVEPLFFSSPAGPVAGSQRRSLSPSTGATDGGTFIVSNSIANITGSCGFTDMVEQFSTACTNFNSVDDIKGLLTGLTIYPNPTINNIVNISYHLETSASVQISIIDYLGRQVLVLNQEKENSGEHEKQIDVTNLSSGLYTITSNINGQLITNKLIKI